MTSSNYDVLDLEKLNENPYCPHGPTILFSNEKKKFFACSACRDHKVCSFYAIHKTFSEKKLKIWHDRYVESQKTLTFNTNNLKKVQKLNADERKYCRTCGVFVCNSESIHEKHDLLTGINDLMLNKPIVSIIEPAVLNSSNAQFLFDESTTQFIVNQIRKFSFDSVMCIGTPSIFEKLADYSSINRILLDIDPRFSQFYENDLFIRYNMFNNHFFSDKEGYTKFLNKSKKLLIIMDPPFGGIVKLISHSIDQIKGDCPHKNVSVILFYPYFIESWIKKWQSELKMIDYKVSYRNQKKFSQNSTQKKGSTARLFTNLDSSLVELPADEGYYLCTACKKYTYKENKHCKKCKACTSKDGGNYKHCTPCSRCVKISYKHCSKCNRCHLDSLKDCQAPKRAFKRKLDSNSDDDEN